jgi:hypothetical protein
MNHRYTLQPYQGLKSRYPCPKCQHRARTFKRYIDTQTNTHLADHVGRCDRVDNCGYHYTPKEFFKANPNFTNTTFMVQNTKPKRTYSVMPSHLIEQGQKGNHSNNFIYFLREMFGQDKADELCEMYNVGTASHWPGATVFWQVDTNDRVRTGKIMLYYLHNCKRVKDPYNHIAWAHSLLHPRVESIDDKKLTTKEFTLKQCLFGEHLLKLDPFKTVAIVESEKTAIIATFYMPQYLWLAAGGLEGLNPDKCKVLKDRTVILFPDVKGYGKWQEKAYLLNHYIPSAHFSVSDELERTADPGDRARGVDIADLWIEELMQQWELEREWGLRE